MGVQTTPTEGPERELCPSIATGLDIKCKTWRNAKVTLADHGMPDSGLHRAINAEACSYQLNNDMGTNSPIIASMACIYIERETPLAKLVRAKGCVCGLLLWHRM